MKALKNEQICETKQGIDVKEMPNEEIAALCYGGIYSKDLRRLLRTFKENSERATDLDLDLDLKNQLKSSKTSQFNAVLGDSGRRPSQSQLPWDPLIEREATPQIQREWRAICLRGFIDPKKFYKGNKSKVFGSLPRKFDVGVIVGDSRVRVGGGSESQAAGVMNSRKRRRGVSVLSQMLSEDQSWSRTKYQEIQSLHTSGGKGWYARRKAS